MASVYILYSKKLDCFYCGSCMDLSIRFTQHKDQHYPDSFTARTDDWELFWFADELEYKQARAIEAHIKRMKSKKYIQNLQRYPEMLIKLKQKYCT